MLTENPLSLTLRLKELLLDWLVISAYLISLFLLAMGFYQLVFGRIPSFSEMDSQVIATVTSVLPISLFFAYLDHKGGSLGKRKVGLSVYFHQRKFRYSLIRNLIKFLPWQLGHMATIRGIYRGFDSITIFLDILALGLLFLLFFMGTCRKDKRHLGDLLAGSQVRLQASIDSKR